MITRLPSLLQLAQLNPEKSDIAIPYFFKGMDETIAQPNAEDLSEGEGDSPEAGCISEKSNGYWLGALSTYERGWVLILEAITRRW